MATQERKRMNRTDDDSPSSSLSSKYPFRHPLDTGDKGVLVMWAQSKLMKHGHYEGPLDGRYDREVTLAVRQFQGSHDLKVTGVIDRKTWDAL